MDLFGNECAEAGHTVSISSVPLTSSVSSPGELMAMNKHRMKDLHGSQEGEARR